MARQAQPKRSAAGPSDQRLIAIRADNVDTKERIEAFIPGESAQMIVRKAREWGYILRVRTRWAGDPDMRDHFGEKAVKDLEQMGIAHNDIQRLASVEHIEVELYNPASTAADAASPLEAAAEIPWEYLLSAATQALGRTDLLLVTRCFSNGSAVLQRQPRQVLVVESAPGRIDEIYGFDDEETRLEAAVNLKEGRGLTFARTEPYSKLQETLREGAWDAIHVTGVDTHQAAWLIEVFYEKVDKTFKAEVIKDDQLLDGMILRGDQKSEQPVRYDQLADLLLGSRTLPRVVTLNLYYSGARTARELVSRDRGAYAALGFLDEIDDEFAELFFQAFYWAWCRDKLSIAEAFREAWKKMDSDRLYGTSIVIWLGRSVFAPPTSGTKVASSKQARRRGR